MKQTFLIFLLILFMRPMAGADTLVLKNGNRINAQEIWEENGRIRYFQNGRPTDGILAEDIKILEKEVCIHHVKNYLVILLKDGTRIPAQGIMERKDQITYFAENGGDAASIPQASVKWIEKEVPDADICTSMPEHHRASEKQSPVRQGETQAGSGKQYAGDDAPLRFGYIRKTYMFSARGKQMTLTHDISKQQVIESENNLEKYLKEYKREANQIHIRVDYKAVQKWQTGFVKKLYETLKQTAAAQGMNEKDFIFLMAEFVQHLNYKTPPNPYGFWMPVICLKEAAGDCDSMSTLFATIYYHFKRNSCILVITPQHAFIGIKNQHKTSPADHVVKIGGMDYLLIELTSKWGVGKISKKHWEYITGGQFDYIPFY
jgi:hypothetical protein